MDFILQIWAGGFYLVNKILFSFSEGKQEAMKRKLRIFGWLSYILGVPAWGIILIGKFDWIAAFMEFGGLPAMFLGLYNTINKQQNNSKILNRFVLFCTYGCLIIGIILSFLYHAGITSITQLLELGVMVGFLAGGYLMARENRAGWLFFMLMNSSMGTLMFIQDKPILMIQQAVSLCFVLYGFIKSSQSNQSS